MSAETVSKCEFATRVAFQAVEKAERAVDQADQALAELAALTRSIGITTAALRAAKVDLNNSVRDLNMMASAYLTRAVQPPKEKA